MSKIIKLTSQNVKRLSAIEITPDGNVVVIGGRNGQGKSSVLDSIMYALGGKDKLPQKPVREGQDGAEITVDLGDLIVKRTFTAAGGTNLVVSNKEGAKFPSPQSILDKLVGTLSFDPLDFARNADGQAETLRRMVGLDFAAMDADYEAAYNERTVVNREVKAIAAQVSAKPLFLGVPDEEVKIADILSEQQEASNQNAANAKSRAGVDELVAGIAKQEKAVLDLDDLIISKLAAIQEIQKGIKTMEENKAAIAAEIPVLKSNLERRKKFIGTLTDIDLAPFKTKAETAEETNGRIRSNKARANLVEQQKQKQAKSDALTAKLDGIEAAKQKAITEAKYPIPGLSFDKEGNVLYNGIPFSQASSADQTKVSIAIGLALNPTLRVLLIRDGSLLDEDSLAMVADIAAKNDAQVWMERVSTGGEVSVIIEDGMVAA